VREPRAVLAEFGITLPEGTAVRVWDSTAEVRYLVIPMRPAGTEGWTQDQLANLVTRDSMIGTGLALPALPSEGAEVAILASPAPTGPSSMAQTLAAVARSNA
jgi:nitrile hydratase